MTQTLEMDMPEIISNVEKIQVPENAKKIYTKMPYIPREIQREIHRIIDGYRFSVLVAHRRFGKTIVAINQLIRRACKDQLKDGIYAYVAPYRNQAKTIAWSYLKKYTAPIMNRVINEQELSITIPGNITLRIFGADNPDALRGMYFDGVVLDEVAQMKREVWTEIIRPALADRNGWALFIGTPKGANLFHELYIQAQNDTTESWVALLYRVTDTNVLPDAEVEKIKGEMGENAFRQEFMCDFSAASEDMLISIEEATAATKKSYAPNEYLSTPMVFGVDVARFGNDRSVIFMRRGLVAEYPVIMAKQDNIQVSSKIISLYHQFKPMYIFVDAGQGQGVIDMLRQHLNCVIEVPFGGSALDSARFINRRSEMWFSLREWIRKGGKIPNIAELITEVSAPFYSYNTAGKIQLEGKESIKERIGVSPDLADALALTLAMEALPEVGGRQQYAEYNRNIFNEYDNNERQEYADGIQHSLLG